MGFFDRVGDVFQGAYHQANMWDDNRTFATNWRGQDPWKPAAAKPTPAPKLPAYKPSPTPGGDAFTSNLLAELRRLQNSIPPAPRLANFNVMANWQAAQSAAERAVNPLYDKYLNDFLAQTAAKKSTKQREFNLNLETIGQEKDYTLGENQVQRGRTAEDVTSALEKIGKNEEVFQTDEGQQFDTNYRKAAEELAAGGMATSGIGKQSTADQIRLRNVSSQRQLDEFQGQREAKNLFKTRTFEDLTRGDNRATQLAESKTKAAQFDLDKYLEDLGFEETKFRQENEFQRLQSVFQESQTREKTGVEQFLAGLVGQGYSAQDIAANRQVYA